MHGKKAARLDFAWDDVRLFLALCRARTVGRAAQALKVDASTVSRRLVTLETALSATLFDRGRDGVTPTQAAEDLLPVAEEIEAMMDRLANAAEGLEREATGLVRITCPPDVAEVVVAPLLRPLHDKHPQLQIELNPGETMLDLTRREADLALRTVRPTRGDLLVQKLASVRWQVAASPKLVRKLGTLRAWADAPWITWGERLAHVPAARWLASVAKDVAPVVRSDSMTLQLSLLRAGVGVGLVPDLSAAHYGLAPVKLSAALRADAASLPTDDLFLVTHRALRNVPRVRAVWDVLTTRYA